MAGKGDSYRPTIKKVGIKLDLAFGKKKGKKNERSSTGKTGKRGRNSRKD